MLPSPTLRLRRWLRKIWHVAGLIFSGAYFFGWYDRDTITTVAAALTLLMVMGETLRFANPRAGVAFRKTFNLLLRDDEDARLHGSLSYMLGVFLAFAALPPRIAAAGVASLAVGDAAADVIGSRWGRFRLLGDKTMEGTVACAVATWLVCYPLLGVTLAAAGAAACALTELLTPRRYDNVTIPFGAAAGVYLMAWVTRLPPNVKPF